VSGMLNGLLALASLVLAIVCFLVYQRNANNLYFILTIVLAALFLIFGGLFLSGRVNRGEDIHITE
jgi:hypothetical protein